LPGNQAPLGELF